VIYVYGNLHMFFRLLLAFTHAYRKGTRRHHLVSRDDGILQTDKINLNPFRSYKTKII